MYNDSYLQVDTFEQDEKTIHKNKAEPNQK